MLFLEGWKEISLTIQFNDVCRLFVDIWSLLSLLFVFLFQEISLFVSMVTAQRRSISLGGVFRWHSYIKPLHMQHNILSSIFPASQLFIHGNSNSTFCLMPFDGAYWKLSQLCKERLKIWSNSKNRRSLRYLASIFQASEQCASFSVTRLRAVTITMRYDKQRRLPACSAIAPQNSFFFCYPAAAVILCGSGAHACVLSFSDAFFHPERRKILPQLFFVCVNPERRPDAQNGLGQEEITPKHHTLVCCSIITHCLRLSLTLYRQCRPASQQRESGAACCIHRSLFLTAAGVVSHYYY